MDRHIIFITNDQSQSTGNQIINSKGNRIKVNLSQNINLPQLDSTGKPQKWYCALRQLSLSRCFPTIFTGDNDVINFDINTTISGFGNFTIIFEQGVYSLTAINNEIERLLISIGAYRYAFKLIYDASTNKTYVQINDPTLVIYRDQSTLLTSSNHGFGFSATGSNLSSAINGFQVPPESTTKFGEQDKYVFITCNIISSSLNDKADNILCQVDISDTDIGVSSYITLKNQFPVFVPVHVNSVQNIEISAVNQSLEDLDLSFGDPNNPQGFSATLELLAQR